MRKQNVQKITKYCCNQNRWKRIQEKDKIKLKAFFEVFSLSNPTFLVIAYDVIGKAQHCRWIQLDKKLLY